MGWNLKWAGMYRIADDTFDVFRTDKIEHRLIIEFTPDEAAAIEAASKGQDRFNWNPPDNELTKGSRADWARM